MKKKNCGQIVLNSIFIFFTFCYILPLAVLVASAFTKELALAQYGYNFWPSEFSLDAFKIAFRNPMSIVKSYIVTITVSAVSTITFVIMTSLLAYPMSRLNYRWHKQLNFMVLFTMLFKPGMVPTYLLLVKGLGVDNSIWALILPGIINAYYVMVVRTSYSSLPNELIEAAKIDGASEFKICFGIMIPLSKASIASVAFLFFVERWNDWERSMIYIKNPDLYMLQYLLQKILREAEAIKGMADPNMFINPVDVPAETLRFAMALIAAGPVLIIFPFFQKYFTKGITIGGVKG